MKISGVIWLLVVAGVGYFVWKNWATIAAASPASNPVANGSGGYAPTAPPPR